MTKEQGSGVEGVRYAIIPEWILDSDATDKAVRLFGVLARYVGANENAWPKRRTLAERLGCNEKTIDRAIDELERIGALVVQHNVINGMYQASTYWLWPKSPDGGQNCPQVETELSPTVGSKVSKQEGESVRKKVNEYSSDFEAIWAIYPRKTNKAGAFKAYQARIKAGVEVDILKDAVANYVLTRLGQDPEYTMHCATFFGPNERYLDFLPVDDSPYNMSAEERSYAQVWDAYDLSGEWLWDYNFHTDNPSKYGIARPQNNDGYYLDASGIPYSLDSGGNRVRAGYWGGS